MAAVMRRLTTAAARQIAPGIFQSQKEKAKTGGFRQPNPPLWLQTVFLDFSFALDSGLGLQQNEVAP
jgi:hypothetical protein